ncbi:MAG: phosphoglycolate phosphatase [Betaproteobacteria bacterium]|jgi:phosphoglycolate phosphatase
MTVKSTTPFSVKAVMIDLDGTMLDTIPDLAAAVNTMLKALGQPSLDESLIRTFVGKGIHNLIERSLTGRMDGVPEKALFDRALPLYENAYTALNGRHTTMYSGVLEGLNELRARGFPLVCVTNKSARFTLPLLEYVGLASYFKAVVAGDTLAQRKPHPAPLLYACEQLGVEPSFMLMVGDSLNDAQAARAAGCPIFCVNYGYNEGQDVSQLDVDAIVGSLVEVSARITRHDSVC